MVIKKVLQQECEYCNTVFKAKTKRARYCTDTCRKMHHKSGDGKSKKFRKNKACRGKEKLLQKVTETTSLLKGIEPRICMSCGATLPRNNKSYCNRYCQKQHTDLNKLNNYFRSGFLRWWLGQFKRSWCLGVLHNPDGSKQVATELLRLYEVYKGRNRANGTGELRSKRWELCHKDPAKGTRGRYGLLHYSNFLIGDALMNRRMGNKEFDFNLSAIGVANMMRPNSFTDAQLIHILNHYLDGAVLEMLNEKPSMVARKGKQKAPNLEPLTLERVLELNLDSHGYIWSDYGYFDSAMRFVFNETPEQMQYQLITNNFTIKGEERCKQV